MMVPSRWVIVICMFILDTMAAENGGMNINIQQPNAHMYHQQSGRNDQFTYGYHVNTVSDQFQHKVKGPDDVTYGCYGYIDPSNKKHLVYYVADRMGYRIIFPNRPTKIFAARLTDSFNKLDGSLKATEYDEKVVAWNDLYLPESCFRLEETLSTAASTSYQEVVRPDRTTTVDRNSVQPELPQPTQYTNPAHPPIFPPYQPVTSSVDSNTRPAGDLQTGSSVRTTQTVTQFDLRGGREDTFAPADGTNFLTDDEPGQLHVQGWRGTQPDINPTNINLDQFRVPAGVLNTASRAQVTSQQQNVNLTQLLAQIEAANAQAFAQNALLSGLAQNPATFSSANANSCQQMVQLLRNQKTSPQLVYVPILIPYVEGQHNVNQPFGAAADSQQQQRACPNCKG